MTQLSKKQLLWSNKEYRLVYQFHYLEYKTYRVKKQISLELVQKM
jgi:hypothetical protein